MEKVLKFSDGVEEVKRKYSESKVLKFSIEVEEVNAGHDLQLSSSAEDVKIEI